MQGQYFVCQHPSTLNSLSLNIIHFVLLIFWERRKKMHIQFVYQKYLVKRHKSHLEGYIGKRGICTENGSMNRNSRTWRFYLIMAINENISIQQ